MNKRRTTTHSASTPTAGAAASPWSRLSGVAVAALAGALLYRLAAQAGRASLFSDECFHAYAAEWIAGHGRLPERLSEFYGGLWYSYPPLLHLIGAGWIKLAGVGGIVEINVILFALLLAVLAWMPIPGVAATPRRWAVLLCIANGWLATYAVGFFAEILISLLGLVAVLAVLRHHHSERTGDALLAGVATGLALLAKQTALMLPGLLLGLAGAALLMRRPARARGLLLATGVAIAIALPLFIRNAHLYGSPIYPALAPDVDRDLYRLYQMQSGYTLKTFLGDCLKAAGPYILAISVLALVVGAVRRRGGIVLALLALCATGVALGWLSPLHNARHLTPLIALVALLASILIHEALRSRPRLVAALEVALLVLASVSVLRLPDLRRGHNVPSFLRVAYDAARTTVPKDATILSLWTYDTFYYARRAATWPLAWGQRGRLVELFQEEDADRFLAILKREEIDYLLVPRWQAPAAFEGSNYNQSFVVCAARLIGEGKLRVVWKSQLLGLIQVLP